MTGVGGGHLASPQRRMIEETLLKSIIPVPPPDVLNVRKRSRVGKKEVSGKLITFVPAFPCMLTFPSVPLFSAFTRAQPNKTVPAKTIPRTPNRFTSQSDLLREHINKHLMQNKKIPTSPPETHMLSPAPHFRASCGVGFPPSPAPPPPVPSRATRLVFNPIWSFTKDPSAKREEQSLLNILSPLCVKTPTVSAVSIDL